MANWGVGSKFAIGKNAGRKVLLPLAQALTIPGAVNGNFASMPHAAGLIVTGDIDIRVFLSCKHWTDLGIFQYLWSKASTGGQFSYNFGILPSGQLLLFASSDGTATLVNANSTIILPFSNGTRSWLKAIRVAATGTVTFYTSIDGVNWVQLGGAVAGTAGAIFSGTDPIGVGGQSISGNAPIDGSLYYAELRNGIDGPVVASFNPNRALRGALTVSSPTDEVWTINRAGAGQVASLL